MTYRDVGFVLIGAGVVVALTPIVSWWGRLLSNWLDRVRWRRIVRASKRRRTEPVQRDRGRRGSNSYGGTPDC